MERMVAALATPQLSRKTPSPTLVWLIPGEEAWEIHERAEDGSFPVVRELSAEETGGLSRVNVAALPTSLVTCQLFWLETTEEKAVPDLVRMQCERRALLRQNEVWRHRVLRSEDGRSLVQVLILRNAIPPTLAGAENARFEVMARCLSLPAQSAGVWRSLGTVSLALTGADGPVYFQSLPHRELTPECLGDIRTAIWMAQAQGWVPAIETLALVGNWMALSASELEHATGLRVVRVDADILALPEPPQELVPREVRKRRITHRRRRRIVRIGLVVAALYAAFLSYEILTGVFLSTANSRLRAQLDAIMPAVQEMQNTARRLDALNPALDTKTYPLEILYRVTALLPEQGVRLTRFEITADRLEIGGESTTAREAFDFMRNLQEAEALRHITWDDPPQPIPLPNDTTRFSIQGTIQGAFHPTDDGDQS